MMPQIAEAELHLLRTAERQLRTLPPPPPPPFQPAPLTELHHHLPAKLPWPFPDDTPLTFFPATAPEAPPSMSPQPGADVRCPWVVSSPPGSAQELTDGE
ncbi:hypothetical protein JZ751_011204 [Albula glossodonta]|uniref:Uncharacterized protein n=1 Tax=Albula glossodonta TaxID=121402 RepID=A0A8T2NWL9_9TELE|nr:hypothetical protein JZ751_011204 [Albula glossodonta]